MTSKNKKQTKQQNRTYVDNRHDDRVRYAYFARYMMVRYFVIAFFFANFFWLLVSYSAGTQPGMILAAVATVWCTVSVIEQLSKLHNKQADVPRTRQYLIFQLVLNLVMSVCLFTPLKSLIYPFATNKSATLALLCILLIGIAAAAAALVRIRNICLGRDKYLPLIRNAEKSRALDQE
ncbi:hypothetical protein lacNasYZ03_07360 [Lactobacillus nasalidis]|uniref:PTS cellobiose transporter subunit IIA n=1 Tax=Lactobacillus nasalidis TaxID=2797258 RepID=A0ABQ3W6W3_9LACO|nr:hypothetical protein [Lactobacillus nasalidis]GHW01049.1 hypothetical protein lacNasYZ03_07360 [Lactobacillus nasalidis]